MKSKYKYLILIILTILSSYAIYTYVEANQIVETKEDILTYQTNKEETFLNSENYTLNNPNIILNSYDISPLTALVVFETNDLTAVQITVKGKDGDDDITNTFTPARVHTLPIYGLYSDYENTVIIKSGNETKEIKIKTEKLPDSIKNTETYNQIDTNDFYFTMTNDGYPTAYDKNGNVRWYLTKNYKWDITRLNNGHILLGSDTSVGSDYSSSLVEMDLLGKVYSEYNLKGGYHHDVYELDSGNLLVATNNFDGGTVEDYIVEIDRTTGEIIKEFDLYDLIPNGGKNNWFGLNSIEYDSKTNSILVTGSKKNMIIDIDYASGEINWIIGDKVNKKLKKYLLTNEGEVNFPNSSESIILSDDNIAFISHENDGSYLISYNVDVNDRTFKQNKHIKLSDNKDNNFKLSYNDEIGYIVSSSDKIIIVDEDATDVLKTSNICSAKLTHLYDADIYIAGRGQRLGSLGVSKTTKNTNILFHKADDSIYEKYNLNLYKDVNRLVVSGKFKKTDEVQIILDNVFDKKTYNVSMSSYTSDKSGKYVNTETYINEDELSGKYYIYIKINDTVYKLHKYVNFW